MKVPGAKKIHPTSVLVSASRLASRLERKWVFFNGHHADPRESSKLATLSTTLRSSVSFDPICVFDLCFEDHRKDCINSEDLFEVPVEVSGSPVL